MSLPSTSLGSSQRRRRESFGRLFCNPRVSQIFKIALSYGSSMLGSAFWTALVSSNASLRNSCLAISQTRFSDFGSRGSGTNSQKMSLSLPMAMSIGRSPRFSSSATCCS